MLSTRIEQKQLEPMADNTTIEGSIVGIVQRQLETSHFVLRVKQQFS